MSTIRSASMGFAFSMALAMSTSCEVAPAKGPATKGKARVEDPASGKPDRPCPGFEALARRVDDKARARADALERAATPTSFDTVVIGSGWAGTIAASCARDPAWLVLGQADVWHAFGDFRAGQRKAEAPCLPKQPAAFEFASFKPGDFVHAATIGAAVLNAQDSLDLRVAYEEVTAVRHAQNGAGSRYEIAFENGKSVLATKVLIATGVGDSNMLSPAQLDPALDRSLRSSDPPVVASEGAFLARYGALCEKKAPAIDALGDIMVFGAGPSGGQIAEALAESSHRNVYFAGPEAALASLRSSLGAPGHRLAGLFAQIDAGAPKMTFADAIAHVTQLEEGGKRRIRVELSLHDGGTSAVVVDRLITAISHNPARTRELIAGLSPIHLVPVEGRGDADPRLAGVPVGLRVEGEDVYFGGAVAAVISPENAPWGMSAEEGRDYWARYRSYYERQPDPDARIPTGFLVVGPALQDLVAQLHPAAR